ncbi:MAG: hypothetical protein RE469_04270 [Cuniculiplasma divulgatum]|jgi:hypothetical protein|nr:MAG: hypothetical protein RE469_04270 [Cuniculiplasma divulgatum]
MIPEPSFDKERKHVVSFMSAKNLDSELLMKSVNPGNAIPLSVLTLNDLAIYPGIGLYFFYNMRNELQYVGKCTSRSFMERIPSHFDCRNHARFATIARRRVDELSQSDDISETVYQALTDLKLFLVNFMYDKIFWDNGSYSDINKKQETGREAEYIEKLERDTIQKKEPHLNRMNKRKSTHQNDDRRSEI